MKAKPKRWTADESRLLREQYGRMPLADLAARLGRTPHAVKSRAGVLGLQQSRLYTAAEQRVLVRDYRRRPAGEIAAALGRSVSSVYAQATKLGLAARQHFASDAEIEQALRTLHPQGYSDREIADELGNTERHRVGVIRRRLGWSTNKCSARFRRQVAEKTRQQLEAAGLESLAEVRTVAFRDYAARNGWPGDLRPRAVQMLNAMYDHGPQTRRQLCDRVGMPWKGSRKSLVSNDPEGSYLAHLQARGLVRRLGRVVKGRGRGSATNLYAVPITIKRGDPQTWPEEATNSSIRNRRLRKRRRSRRSSGTPCSTV